ncbi:hypothetical protein SLNSH_17050 [Alsobacter soli]|uniref:Uncharacterized protein n=1 Tax=Alsobacter soli TaxID=2109933 RepID=A0A2T1HQB3_9HYPH|nr:hypothetical protein [Alsobacter soli]PSC03817.1 hypothetical protein SLNSH_17050 [Alsobacter soli]
MHPQNAAARVAGQRDAGGAEVGSLCRVDLVTATRAALTHRTEASETAREIEEEQCRGRLLRQPEIDFLIKRGVPPGAILRDGYGRWSMLRIDEVVRECAGMFEFSRYSPDQKSLRAYTFVGTDRYGEPCDVVAWDPKSDELLSWSARAIVAGEDELVAPRLEGGLRVHASALDWLRAGRRGVLVVDWERAGPLLRDEGSLLVDDKKLGRRLLDAISITPKILLDEKPRARE